MAALVTGASAGLGDAFARALAAQGQDLILTARRAERLDALAAELAARFGVRAAVIPLDLGLPDGPDRLMEEIARAGLEVSVLVNNAGFGARGSVAELPAAAQLGQIDLNCRALVALTHAVLPAMLARREGAILNVASLAAFVPGPWMAVYYATKSFVLSFSEALHEEVKGQGVRVSALCPGPVATEFAAVAGTADTELFRHAASAGAVVRDGLDALAANRAVKVSGLRNTLTAQGTRFAPRAFLRRMSGRLQKTKISGR